MKIIRSVSKMQEFAKRISREGKSIGFVPTMGYLHQGHLSLLGQAKKDTDVVVISIFVNPIQFGPKEGLKKYPRDFNRDTRLAGKAGADIIFYPSAKDMYCENHRTYVEVEGLCDVLCGKDRPGHFKGVATVVAKLFNIVRPDIAYFGEKDAQQVVIIQRMARDLNIDLKIKVMPTVREPDGLAASSRNVYLSPTQRRQALVLKNALQKAKDMVSSDEKGPKKIKDAMRRIIETAPSAKIDYISIVNSQTLQDVKSIKGEILAALAIKIGKTRLIDNAKIHV